MGKSISFLVWVYFATAPFYGLVVAATQQAHHIQENVDKVQIQVQRADDGRFLQHGRIAAKVGVMMPEHLGVIGGNAHKQQQPDGAQQQVAKAEAKAQQAEQPAHQRADDQRDQTAEQLGTPAGQVLVGGGAVHRHNAKIDSAHQKRQHQRAEAVRHKQGGQVQTVQHRIPEEQPCGGGGLQAHHPGGQNHNQHQLADGGHPNQTAAVQRYKQPGGDCGKRHGKGDQQTGKHPAKGFGHIFVQGAEGTFGVGNIVIVWIHSCIPLSLCCIIGVKDVQCITKL